MSRVYLSAKSCSNHASYPRDGMLPNTPRQHLQIGCCLCLRIYSAHAHVHKIVHENMLLKASGTRIPLSLTPPLLPRPPAHSLQMQELRRQLQKIAKCMATVSNVKCPAAAPTRTLHGALPSQKPVAPNETTIPQRTFLLPWEQNRGVALKVQPGPLRGKYGPAQTSHVTR